PLLPLPRPRPRDLGPRVLPVRPRCRCPLCRVFSARPSGYGHSPPARRARGHRIRAARVCPDRSRRQPAPDRFLPPAIIPPVLLAIDVGNTQTHLGMFRDDELLEHWRLATG